MIFVSGASLPFLHVEHAARRYATHCDSAKAKRSFPPAYFRQVFGFEKIGWSGADDFCLAVRFEKNRSVLFDRYRAHLCGPAVLQYTRQENEQRPIRSRLTKCVSVMMPASSGMRRKSRESVTLLP